MTWIILPNQDEYKQAHVIKKKVFLGKTMLGFFFCSHLDVYLRLSAEFLTLVFDKHAKPKMLCKRYGFIDSE